MAQRPVRDMTSDPQPPRLSIRRNIAFAMAGRGYYALSQFAIIALTARLGTPEDVGALTLATAIVTPLFFLTAMGMRDALTVDDLDRFGRADYVGLRLAGSFVAVGLSMAAVLILYGDRGSMIVLSVLGVSLVKFFGAQASLNHALFQRAERLDYVAGSILARATAGLLAFAVVFYQTRDLPSALLAEAVAWFLSSWLVDKRFLSRLHLEPLTQVLRQVRPGQVARLAVWIMPVGLALLLMRASNSVAPVLLERHAGLAAVGLFGALAYVHTGLSMLANALGSATAARLRRYLRDGAGGDFIDLATRLTRVSLALGLVAVGLAWLLGAPFLRLVFGAEYAERELFTIIVAASALSLVASPLVTAVMALQAFRWRILISGAGFLSACVAGLLLIPPYGVFGAAWSFLASALAYLLVTLAVCARLARRNQGARGFA